MDKVIIAGIENRVHGFINVEGKEEILYFNFIREIERKNGQSVSLHNCSNIL
jgi:hypothetical protein